MRMPRYALILPLIFIVVACLVLFIILRQPGADETPGVKILSPSDPHTIPLGEVLTVESRVNDDDGFDRVELRVNDSLVHTAGVPPGEKSYRLVQSWQPTAVGAYEVTVTAFDTDNQASEPARLNLIVHAGPTSTALPGPGATATPLPGSQPTATPVDTGPGGCTYDATFITDVTIPDDTEMAPGTEFVKTWRLRNSGTCDWGSGFQFVFVDGERMDSSASVNVPSTPAGATADISVRFKAPSKPGKYRSRWRMRTPDGREFGDRPFVRIVVPPPPTATPPVTPTATASPEPDLSLEIGRQGLALQVGQPLALPVTVRNNGPGALDQPTLVRAVLWAGLQIESSVSTLPAGGQQEITLNHVFTAPADLEAVVSVDPGDEIAETDEDNNVATVAIVVEPSVYASRTITVTPGLGFDLDDAQGQPAALDLEWRVAEGAVYVGPLNDAAVTRLSGEVERVSYALVAGSTWETEQLLLDDLAGGVMFGFRTNEGRLGYARVEALLDKARTSARLAYWVWDWPQ